MPRLGAPGGVTMGIRTHIKRLLRMCGHAFNITVHERLDHLEERVDNLALPDSQAALLEAAIRNSELLGELAGKVSGEAHFSSAEGPEARLAQHLYSCCPSRTIGASGEVWGADRLKSTGYIVHEFEIKTGWADDLPPNLCGLYLEIEGTGEDLLQEVPLAIPTLGIHVRRSGAQPAGLEGDRKWVVHLQASGYPWFLVVYRKSGAGIPEFHTNYPVLNAEGPSTVFFFREYAHFQEAVLWCSASLKRIYF
jgi:hypothetical protein